MLCQILQMISFIRGSAELRRCYNSFGMKLFLLALLAIKVFAQPYDVIIHNGHIVDGTGSPWYSGDVAIQNGRIAAIGQLAEASAERVIDAGGLVVAPGFI